MMWVLWLLIGFGLLIAEILTPGFVLGSFAIGCFFAAFYAYFEYSVTVQTIVFIVSNLLVFFAVRPVFLKYVYGASVEYKTNVDALVGKSGYVEQIIEPAKYTGRIKVGGESWKAVSYDESIIEEGSKVVVRQVEGSKLIVERVKPQG